MVIPTRRREDAFTRKDMIALVIIVLLVAILAGVVVSAFIRAPGEMQRRQMCLENLVLIGKAVAAYQQDNNGYFPFCQMPADTAEARKKDAMTSIAQLYPTYVAAAKVFHCPSTETEPHFILNVPQTAANSDGDGRTNRSDAPDGYDHFWNQRNHTLGDSSYGYDCRLSPRVPGKHAVLADMDGSHGLSMDRYTANHDNGQIVLYSDGHVKWWGWDAKNLCSNTPNDNIFAEDSWHADTDSFISDNTSSTNPADVASDQYNDLSVSYDPYPDLHPR